MKIIKMITVLLGLSSTASAGEFEKDTFLTPNGKEIVIYAIKHGSLRITYDGLEIEVDPVSKMEPATDYSKLPKADYILVTHEHHDHLDAQAINDLTKKGTILITNNNCSKILGKGEVMKNGDQKKLKKGILLDAVPAYNTSEGRTQFHPKGRDNGFILTLDGFRIYIAGDTEDIPEMKEMKNIDVAFLPTNQPYTMTPEQTANAARIIQPKVLFPYHFGKTKIEEVSRLLKGSGIDVRIRKYQ